MDILEKIDRFLKENFEKNNNKHNDITDKEFKKFFTPRYLVLKDIMGNDKKLKDVTTELEDIIFELGLKNSLLKGKKNSGDMDAEEVAEDFYDMVKSRISYIEDEEINDMLKSLTSKLRKIF